MLNRLDRDNHYATRARRMISASSSSASCSSRGAVGWPLIAIARRRVRATCSSRSRIASSEVGDSPEFVILPQRSSAGRGFAKPGLAAARLGCHRVTPIVHYDKITEPHKQPEPAVVSPTGHDELPDRRAFFGRA